MSNQVFVQPNGVIYHIYEGNQTPFSVDRLIVDNDEHVRRLRSQGKPVLIVGDARRIGKTSIAFRQAGSQALKNGDFDRLAVFGFKTYLRHVFTFMTVATGTASRVRTFTTEKQAVDWLLAS